LAYESGTISDGKAFPIIKDEIEHPVRLLVDTIQQKIYWADDGLHKIERANFDGSQRGLYTFFCRDGWKIT